MAAGLGFKNFNTGDVLSAADTNGYLMQGVWVFDNAAARDAAVTSPQEGNFAYLKDTNVTTYYTGSTWANLDTTGMTNPMTTTGDTIYSSSGSTPARLPIGTTGQVLTVAGGVPTWASAGGGGKVLQVVQGTVSSNTTSSSTSFVDVSLSATITPSSSSSKVLVLVSAVAYAQGSSGFVRMDTRLVRTSTEIAKQEPGVGQVGASIQGAISYSFLDSPSTTSATTYKIQAKKADQADDFIFNYNSSNSTITLMEIGA